ncbi:N-acetylmuramoyl-L-alanine amidase, partial [Salinicoccus roseus]
MTIKMKKKMVSTSRYSLKCPNKMNAEYITIHNA